MNQNNLDLTNFNEGQLLEIYPSLIHELKRRNLITTVNIIGELGEYYAIKLYNSTPNEVDLTKAPPSNKNVDAWGPNGEAYAVKSLSGNLTGNFSSVPMGDEPPPSFDFLIVVKFNKQYEIKNGLPISNVWECNWDVFKKYRRLKTVEQKYAISITKKFISKCREIPLDPLRRV